MDVDNVGCSSEGEGNEVWRVDCCLPRFYGNGLAYEEAGPCYSFLGEDCVVGRVFYCCFCPWIPPWLLDCEDVVGCWTDILKEWEHYPLRTFIYVVLYNREVACVYH